jgi:glycosyltransferase involved in cell wall biosynthesis
MESFKPDLAYLQNVLNPDTVRAVSRKVPTFRFLHDHRLFCPDGKILWRSLKPCEKPFDSLCLFTTTWHGCMGRNPRRLLSKMKVMSKAIAAARDMKKIVVASDYMKRCLMKQGFDENRLRVNPLFSRFPVVEGHEPREANLLYVGQLSRSKGVTELLKIADQFPEPVKLILVGEAPTKEENQEVESCLMRLSHSEKVIRAGWKSGDDLLRLYRKSFAVIMPSLWPEPFGLVGIEALSQATPVIAFDVGGLGEWLRATGGGEVIRRGDWQKLVRAVRRLFENAGTCKEMGMRGQAYVGREMTLQRHVDRLEEMFQAGAGL